MSNGNLAIESVEEKQFTNDEAWREPDYSILCPEGPTPELPIEAFGDAGAWILRSAESRSTAPGYVAAAFLAVAGSLIGNAYWVNPRKAWEEPPILWFGLVGSPAAAKTPALKCCTQFLVKFQKEKMPEYEDAMKKFGEEKDVAETAKKVWLEDCKKDIKAGRARPIRPDAAITPETPVPPKLTVSDTTAEAAAAILAQHKKGLLVEADELSSFILGIEKYTTGNRGFYLKGFTGEPATIDRKGSEPIHVPRATLGLVGNIQPDLVRELLFSGTNDGFAARILFVWPTIITFEMETPEPNDSIMERAFRRLWELPVPENDEPNLIGMTVEAKAFLGAAAVKYQGDSEAESGHYSEFLGKLRGMAARLSLILEFTDWALGESPSPPKIISKEKTVCALHIINKYFIPMYQKVSGGARITRNEFNAAKFAKYLLKNRRSKFNARQEKRHGGPLKKAGDLDPALEILEDANWIVFDGKREGNTIGQKSKDYLINPKIYEINKNG